MIKICNILYFCYHSNIKPNIKLKSLGIVFLYFLALHQVFPQNPISGNQGFQVISEGNFTTANAYHIHGPLAVGGNMIINTPSMAEINMDNVGSYVFPGDGSANTGLLVKGSVTWTNGSAKVLNSCQ